MPVTPTIEVDDTLKERSSHGSFELPIETYTDNCEIFHSLYNHWHDEMELIYIESVPDINLPPGLTGSSGQKQYYGNKGYSSDLFLCHGELHGSQ